MSSLPLTGTSRRLLLPAAVLLLAILCGLVFAGAKAPAKTLQEKYDAASGKLKDVRKSESDLSATIAEQNQAIDSMIGEVSALRQEQAAAEEELAAKQGELDAASEKLARDKKRLAVVRDRLERALDVLRDRLVAIYESGSPDVVGVVLESSSWSELNARADYLSQLQEYDDSVAGRVKDLRDEARAAVERMAAVRLEVKEARDVIAAKEREAAAARAEADSRFAELKEAQAARRADMEELESQSQALSSNLS